MNERKSRRVDDTLAQLGIRELEQRLEVSPLLAATATAEPVELGDCCTCKIVPSPTNPTENPDPGGDGGGGNDP